MSDQYKVLAGNVEGLQHELAQLKLAAANATVEYERKLEQLKVSHDNTRSSQSREQENLHNIILDAVKLVVVHKEHVADKLKHLQVVAERL